MKDLGQHAQTNCCLCREIRTRLFPDEYQFVYGVNSRIAFETDHFVVLPTLSPLCRGHVLVLPRQHVRRIADVPEDQHPSFLTSVQLALDQVARHFGSTFFYFFEHGANGPGQSCGIDHAHLHMLPISRPTAELVEARVGFDFPANCSGSLLGVLSKAGEDASRGYLLYGTELDSIRLSWDKAVPSQYMRRLIREAENRADWDWKLLNGRSEFLATWGAFRAA